MRRHLPTIVLLSLLYGCNVSVVLPALDRAPARKPAPAKRDDGSFASAAASLLDDAQTRVVSQQGNAATLMGKVKLISDMGGAIISNNGGKLVPLTKLVGNNGASVVSQGGGSLIGPTVRRLAEASALPPEALLADAVVGVRDAQGRLLVDEAGRPLAAQTDLQGAYRLEAVLPDESLVLAVPLWNGGQLSALVARTTEREREVRVDTATSLAAAYVLDRYVKGDQRALDRLPADEADRLHASIEAARGLIEKPPAYGAEELVGLTDRLRERVQAVDQVLEDIKALLLGGSGNGSVATEVPLSNPAAVADDGAGGFLVAEAAPGRVRRVDANGILTTWADQGFGAIKANFAGCFDLARGREGGVYILRYGGLGGSYGVSRVDPDGTVRVVAGTGKPGADPLGGIATETAINPSTIWVDENDGLWIAEQSFGPERSVPRVMTLAENGRLMPAGKPRETWTGGLIHGLTRGPDGTVWAAVGLRGAGCEICSLAPGADSWTLVQTWPEPSNPMNDMVTTPDGTVYVSEYPLNRVSRVARDGTRTPVFSPSSAGRVLGLADMQALPDGRLRVVAAEAGQVLEIDASGRARVVAGAAAGIVSGVGVRINSPFASVAGADGSLYVVGTGSRTVEKWDGKAFETFAGTAPGGELAIPVSLLLKNGSVFVSDHMSGRLKEFGRDGSVVTRVSGFMPLALGAEGAPASGYSMFACSGLFETPGGAIAWSNWEMNQVARWQPGSDRVELMAGRGGPPGPDGEGDDPRLASLDTPFGAAYGPGGDLYISDSLNCRIRRVRQVDGRARIEPFGGIGREATLAAVADAPAGAAPALIGQMPIVFPGSLCFDAAGNMYVAEFGTNKLDIIAQTATGLRKLAFDRLPKVPARVLKVTPGGLVSVVAGPGGRFFGNPQAEDALVLPTHLTMDPGGRLIISDIGANLVRILPAGSY